MQRIAMHAQEIVASSCFIIVMCLCCAPLAFGASLAIIGGRLKAVDCRIVYFRNNRPVADANSNGFKHPLPALSLARVGYQGTDIGDGGARRDDLPIHSCPQTTP